MHNYMWRRYQATKDNSNVPGVQKKKKKANDTRAAIIHEKDKDLLQVLQKPEKDEVNTVGLYSLLKYAKLKSWGLKVRTLWHYKMNCKLVV